MAALTHLVYALSDPKTEEVRYIGKTSVCLTERLKQHTRASYLRPNTHKNCWLRRLLKTGNRPVIDLLEVCDSVEQQNDAEKFWISYWRFIGARLTNATDGGDGQSPGYITKPATKQKISARLKGRPISTTQRQQLSQARYGRPLLTSTRQKISRARKGLRVTQETKARMKSARRFPGLVDENGTVYPTATCAARALKISRTTAWRLLYNHLETANGHTLRYLTRDFGLSKH